jgi:hypothetical protein
MSVTEREKGFPVQQGHSVCQFLFGLIPLIVSDTSGMKDPDRIDVMITRIKLNEP